MPLLQQIEFLEKVIPSANKINLSVSDKRVDWHIDHSLKVIIYTSKALIASNPEDYKWKFNKWRFIIFIKGSFPRGKAKAPKRVTPKEIITTTEIQEQLAEAKELVINLKNLPKKSNFEHPIFGMLKRDKSITFIGMHTQHHINIINDILKV
ncbi:hypothetical protein FRY74_00240 [Vicingus serpentipes]|uniref:DinB family protein n=1 Tax=Vicingus serpentipes TaxID=1926625 RepID=A0A5C6RVS6_9FLAO|nr:hypothetical protein [Vicingus serpentipes]TXB66646.1 hypothetical protein FRY74_00240 [Vicingus serpentipes]